MNGETGTFCNIIHDAKSGMTRYIPPLWEHQRVAIGCALNRYALFFDAGVGKTRTAIELYKKSGHGRAIIFAPLNVCRNWENELLQYLGRSHSTRIVSGQTKAKKIATLESFRDSKNSQTRNEFLICNIESLRSKEYLELLKGCKAPFIIIDESHNFKTYNSLQTKGLLDLVATLKPEYLYLLTATPAPQGEIDLWSTLFLLGKTTDSFFVWRKRYFMDKNERRRGHPSYWPEYVVTPQGKETIAAQLASCSMTARKDQVLDLPPLLHTTLYAEMSPEQKRHYKTMEEFLFAIDKDGNELNAANMLVRTLRLQQILAGFIGDAPMRENPRMKTLQDAITKTNGEQFVIWTIFKSTYLQLQQLLDDYGIRSGMLTGDQTAEERHYTMADFQAGDLRALIAHPKAGGVGVNLTAASWSIHYTRSFSLTDDIQAAARNYRGGSERHKRITRLDIITPDTIDEEIAKALKAKASVQDFILGLKEKHGRHN